MKTIVTITDITRMAPPFVCLAGVRENRSSIRIQFRNSRIDEDWLCNNGTVAVRPFARVGFELISPHPDRPHTEDWFVDKYHLENHGRLAPAQQIAFLSSLCEPCVAAIFGTEILTDPGYYVLKGKGDRSLGTIRVERFFDLSYQPAERSWDCRLGFKDASGGVYVLKVKDLTLCAYLDFLREHERLPPDQIEHRLLRELRGKPCFLRIGLARGWARFPERCYLQVTGVFTAPDYLRGRWFADFASPGAYRPAQPIYPPPHPGIPGIKETLLDEDEYLTSVPPEFDTFSDLEEDQKPF